jgi:predicted N-acyltransferase
MDTERMNYGIRVDNDPQGIDADQWDALLAQQTHPTPFMRHAYLSAMHHSGSASAKTGWSAQFLSLWLGDQLQAACPLYLKSHSYGEYVFDWAWANAYEQHGLAYYPKALVAVPFTPVPGSRLLARDDLARQALLQALQQWCEQQQVSSWHLLFGSDVDLAACSQSQWMQRHTVQFHWQNQGWSDFDAFLASLQQEKRKKIKQERRRVADAGVHFQALRGRDIGPAEWDFFYACYERTYLEHGNAPYLRRSFFQAMASDMPENWLLLLGERAGVPMACSLIGLSDGTEHPAVAYGRYWGALERVDCLHFEACYYQPLVWCLQNGVQRFEGGAQGEHKMARALMPVMTHSAHGVADPRFAQAIGQFLEREGRGVDNYMEHLGQRTPYKPTSDQATKE